jgi:hypothetical protein
VLGRASTTGGGYSPSTARRSCRASPDTIKWVVPRTSPYTRHDNDGPRLSCRYLVRHLASFLSPLMSAPPRHPIRGIERGSRRLLPVFV